MSAAPAVQLLWWRGCPSSEEAQTLVREEMASAGIDPASLEVREIRTDRDAEAERFIGSPTVRIDGRDIRPQDTEPVGLSCRVYRLRDGRFSPLPDRHDLRETLRQATRGGDR
jgi:hypothetical protein